MNRQGVPRRVALVAFATLLMLSWSLPAGAGVARTRETSELQHALDALVAQPEGPPGIIVVIDRGHGHRVFTAGVAKRGTGRRLRETQHMRVASVAKAFTGGVAVALVRRGTLSLDDTVTRWLPNLPRQWANVTLTQLMQHTSGIPDFSDEQGFREALVASLLHPPGHAALLSFIKDPALHFAAGSQYRYSNSDNVIIGLMAESATGKPFASLLTSLVNRKLDLDETSLPEGARLVHPRIHGYDLRDPDRADVTELFAAGWTFSSGGVVSTPSDADEFVRGYVSGRLTDRATHDRQFQFVPGSSEPPGPGINSAGLSVFRYDTRCGTVYGHTGNTAGYTQFIAASADGRRSVTVSINGQITPKTDAFRFADLRAIDEHAVCAALR